MVKKRKRRRKYILVHPRIGYMSFLLPADLLRDLITNRQIKLSYTKRYKNEIRIVFMPVASSNLDRGLPSDAEKIRPLFLPKTNAEKVVESLSEKYGSPF